MNKEKNPKRVEGGKKSVEARKLKEELNRKETELLRKENFELKQKALNETVPQITKEKEKPKERNFIQLFFLSIGICGLGLFIYNRASGASGARVPQEIPKVQTSAPQKEKDHSEKVQKEKDPFDF
jgi:hypothetical protein